MDAVSQTEVKQKYRVVIVGGGTAGWMTAAYLSKAFDHGVDIQLIESSNIRTVGVGEATFSYIHLFFEYLGLSEEEWMPECNASYKLAIRFVDWNAERRHFYHPFQRFDIVQGANLAEWWLKLKRRAAPLDYACFTVPSICDTQRSPRYLDGRVFDSKVEEYLSSSRNVGRPTVVDDLNIQYPYAYHFDANLLASFLAKYAVRRGVELVLDDVVGVDLAHDGSIRSIQTTENGKITGDLFVDSTGFRGLLINQALKEPFISFRESLPCDKAIALQVPHDPVREGINPYTTATALTAGWVWDIPLFHRKGTGYVYASEFLSPEEAEVEFRHHLGSRSEGCNAVHINMRVGRCRNAWVSNCVAIGLSAGFVEPLESTGIFFIQNAIEQLVAHFPSCRDCNNAESIKAYNNAIANCIDGVREFLTIHYVHGTREDTKFWKATKNDLVITDGLSERLQLWKHRLPTKRTIFQKEHGFTAYSYCVMLVGLGNGPRQPSGVVNYASDTNHALAAFDRIRNQAEHLNDTLPGLYRYLCTLYKMDSDRQP